MKIGVCIRAKNEEKIICDWVKHYLKLGFDKIFIYDNLSEPSIESILKKNNLLNNKIYIKIDKNLYLNQPTLFKECIDNNKDLDWLLLCDADEFLWLKDKNIKDFLSTFSEDTSTIFINWLTYGSSNLEKYDKTKTIYEQFLYREEYKHFWNIFVKSFVKPKLIESDVNVHKTINRKYKCCNVYNEIVTNLEKCMNKDLKLSNNTPVLLIHYMTLDFESMNIKYLKHRGKYGYLKNDKNRYSLEWYKNNKVQGFKDNVFDNRMLKYK